MAAISAFHVGAIGVQIDNPNVDHNQFNNALPTVDLGYSTGAARFSGLRIVNQPITPHSREISVFKIPSYERDFYHRIWLIPKTINFSFVPSPIERTFHVWNAHRVGKVLDTLTAENDEGLTLTPDEGSSPYLPDELREYTLEATPDGPPQIEATYTFDFEGEQAVLSVLGIRVVGWTVQPNWIGPVTERAHWLTDLQASYNGTEQRRQLKEGPRVEWEFTFDVDVDERRLLDNTMFAFGGRIFALPIWTDLRFLEAPLSIGAETITVDTTGTDFHDGGLGVLLGPGSSFEAFPIDSLSSSGLILSSPLEQAWPAGTRLFPARASHMLEPRGFGNLTANYARGIGRFRTVEECTRDEIAEDTYRDRPVLTVEPNWRAAPEIDHSRLMELIDYGTGRDAAFDQSDQAFPILRVLWTALDRSASDELHNFIWCRRGRQKSVWIPTFANDLQAIEYEDATRLLTVRFCGLVNIAAGNVHRKDVRIQLADGTVFHRRLGTLSTVSAGISERAQLDVALGTGNLEAAAIRRISWLMLTRLDHDAIEIAWHTPAVAEAVLTFKGPKHDV